MTKRSTIQNSGKAMIYNFLINELLASQLGVDYQFWVVSPWITNFRLPEPYHISFEEIIAARQDTLHLFDVLYQIAANGGTVNITTRRDIPNLADLHQLGERSQRIVVRVLDSLHTKAYAGQYGALDGSPNLTDSGVNKNIELYTYYHDQQNIAYLQHICKQHFDKAEELRCTLKSK